MIPAWGLAALTVAAAAVAALLLHRLGSILLRRATPSTYAAAEGTIVRQARPPARLAFVLVAEYVVTPLLPLTPEGVEIVRHALAIGIIVAVAWAFVALTEVFQVLVKVRFDTGVPDNLRARRVQTKVQLLRRMVIMMVVIVAFGLVLMTFESVRRVGISLFASAGVVGLIIGIAAQPTLANLVAGLQVALTEPIRLDDVVIVEGEWGRVEEIGMTYVVIRIWDMRRLVVPLRHFIDQPFQNWTRSSVELLGTVFLHVDYRTPIDRVREELHRILQGSDLWDGKVWNLQVTDATERTVQIRALMSARDAGNGWELRVLVRERLLDFLQREMPECLPRVRAEVEEGRA
ncbi:MAG: mechanosensitive ion channel family protein [Gemmatimonadetes bacterium]|nr:mechanosensitive ion channel family protein [Gemmatimonadota bacterium]